MQCYCSALHKVIKYALSHKTELSRLVAGKASCGSGDEPAGNGAAERRGAVWLAEIGAVVLPGWPEERLHELLPFEKNPLNN